MIIRELNMKRFGAAKDNKISLEPGINIVYGKNESGKSTACVFALSMLFGIEKKRGRVADTDATKRFTTKTRGDIEGIYSGAMTIEKDGRLYEINRVFPDNKAANVFDQDGRVVDLYKLLPKDKYNEKLYSSTMCVLADMQTSGTEFAKSFEAYADRISGSGDSKADSKSALSILNKKLKTEQEAINELIGRQISIRDEHSRVGEINKAIKNEAKMLAQANNELDQVDVDKNNKAKQIKEFTARYQDIRFEYENYCYMNKKLELMNNMDSMQEDRIFAHKKARTMYYVLLGLLAVALGMIVAFLPVGVPAKLGLGIGILLLLSLSNFLLESRISLFILKRLIRDTAITKHLENEEHKQLISDIKYSAQIIFDYGIKAVPDFKVNDAGIEQLSGAIDDLNNKVSAFEKMSDEDRLNRIRVKDKHEWNLKALYDKLNKRSEEELADLIRQLDKEIADKKTNLELIKEARSIIEEISGEFKRDFNDCIGKDLSSFTASFTAGAYERAIVDDKYKLKVFDGMDFVEASMLSTGTLRQLYLAFRLACAKWLGCFDMPLMIDEGFAYFDDERLKQTLSAINDAGIEQIIIFSCQQREKNILNELGISYNYVDVSQ